MGMFGSSAPGGAIPYDPGQMSGSDRMMMAGAMLRDAASSFGGGDAQNVMAMRNMMAQRQMMGPILQALSGDDSAGGGQAPGAGGATPAGGAPGGTVGGMSPRALRMLAFINPPAARAIVDAQKLNEVRVGPDGTAYGAYDPSMVGHVFGNPQAVNNTIVNTNDPGNINRVIPSAPVPGAMPVYDNQGHVVDWNLPRGAQQAIVQSQAPQIAHNLAMERIGSFEAGTGRMNAGTQASAQANTASQNVVAPPPGFVVRPRPRKR